MGYGCLHHFKKLFLAMDAIPSAIHSELSEEFDLQFSSSSGLPQCLESHVQSESVVPDDDGLKMMDPLDVMPDISVT